MERQFKHGPITSSGRYMPGGCQSDRCVLLTYRDTSSRLSWSDVDSAERASVGALTVVIVRSTCRRPFSAGE